MISNLNKVGGTVLCQDLHRRIDQTRPVPSLEDSRFHYGFNSHYLQKVVSYWRNDFNWKRQVNKLNQFPQFKTKIEGKTTLGLRRILYASDLS